MKTAYKTAAAALALAAIFCGAAAAAKPKKALSSDSGRLKVVTTIFPEYDWVMNILGDKAKDASVTMLLDNGVDLHSYQPTVQDIAKIAAADVFVYVGGESDEWVENALKSVKNKNLQVVNLLQALGDRVKAEEIVEGMEHEHEHDGHGHDDDDHDEHGHDDDHDEHGHGKEVSTFDDHDVKDRSLADWAGNWQSPYPLVLDGTLDEAWEEKAEDGKMTAAEYKDYYAKGYKTDIARLTINGDTITYTFDSGKTVSAAYKYTGTYIQHWSGGTKAAMYRFEAKDKSAGAPVYIEINDHMIEPARAEHFHLRMSNTSYDDIVDPEGSWPTFFPADMSGKDICEHLAGHGHHHHDEEEELDEHVWLSLRNAKALVTAIADALGRADAANAALYKANAAAYSKKLSALDADYAAAVKGAKHKTLLFGDRFPFRYLVDDYGLSYYAAFAGCSAETEASFKTVVFLAGKLDELGLPAVCTIEKSDGKIARTISQNAKTKQAKKAKIMALDSMQATTSKDVKKGASYLGIMQDNLQVLKAALQ